MTVLYFGIYNPDYARNWVLLNGLRKNGVEVLECRESSTGLIKFFKLFLKYWKFAGKYDVMVVGFPGQEVMFLARFLTKNPIIFDAFTSHYEGYILDRRKFPKHSWRATYYRSLDKWSCRLADIVLLDTEAHISFFLKEFGLKRGKFRRLFVGTNSELFYPRDNLEERRGKFLIHFHGYYIPLQGVKYIIKVAKLLENSDVEFNLIGRGQTYSDDLKLAQELGIKNINFIENVPYNVLPEYINKADVCLGIFGDTDKAELVIPNKVFEALACKKPVITSDTAAIRELLKDEEDVILCRRADSNDLADKIIKLHDNNQLKNKVAENGYRLFREKLTEKQIGLELKNIIDAEL